MKLCDSGCNQPGLYYSAYTKKYRCAKSANSCPANKEKNSRGLKQAYVDGRLKGKEKYAAMPARAKENMAWSKGKQLTDNDTIFVSDSIHSNGMVRRRIATDSLIDYKCQMCNTVEWNGKPITLELDHINGINNDNRLENLRFLCPNCHSQTDTYKGKNINSGILKVTDEKLLTAYKNCNNIRQTLIAVGLVAKGGNYARLKRLLEKNAK